MSKTWSIRCVIAALICGGYALPAAAQSFRVQCPSATITHPTALATEPAYTGPTYPTPASTTSPTPTTYISGDTGPVNGTIKCQQISGGDGYATMADGTQTYLFSFGPLSGLGKIAMGQPGTDFAGEFNTLYDSAKNGSLLPGYPATGLTGGQTAYDGAIGQIGNGVVATADIYDMFEGANPAAGVTGNGLAHTVTVILLMAVPFNVGDSVIIGEPSTGDIAGDLTFGGNNTCPTSWNTRQTYTGTYTVTKVGVALNQNNPTYAAPGADVFQFTSPCTNLPEVNTTTAGSSVGTTSSVPTRDGRVDPRQVMDVGVMNGNIPAPEMAIDEDDEYFLTLTNVGMIMRPDLFEQHTVHFHGYPNASSFYDGVPDASVAINIGGSFTYYYLAPDAGTYFYHCHITPPEHLQMGMVGQLYVRPRQDRWSGDLFSGLQTQQGDKRTKCDRGEEDCSNPLPAINTDATNDGSKKYAYNDGDGSTYYDVEYPIQMHGFDPDFHFVGMTFNPEGFADMKDKYFLLNGRSYPDTVNDKPLLDPTVAATDKMATQSADGVNHFSQPLNSIVTITAGQRALLRISDLNVSEYHTLASLGVPMQVIGYNAKLLRDEAGNNMYYTTNSITLGGGESLDVILDTCVTRSTTSDPSSACTAPMPTGTYYLYTPNLDHLSNDAENFGGMMTEVRVVAPQA